MQKWEYKFYCKNVVNAAAYATAGNLWSNKDGGLFLDADGKTALDDIEELGQDGWELVSVTPVTNYNDSGGQTTEILFTFKRPIEG